MQLDNDIDTGFCVRCKAAKKRVARRSSATLSKTRRRQRRRDGQKPKSKEFLGGYAEGVTPVPIPNTEVKPLRADDTARVAVWESRSPPGIKSKKPRNQLNGCGVLLLKDEILAQLYLIVKT